MVKTNMSSNGPGLGPDPNSDSRKLSCRSETAVRHGKINHCVRVASYSAKKWRLESASSVLSFFSLSCGCEEGARHVGAYV